MAPAERPPPLDRTYLSLPQIDPRLERIETSHPRQDFGKVLGLDDMLRDGFARGRDVIISPGGLARDGHGVREGEDNIVSTVVNAHVHNIPLMKVIVKVCLKLSPPTSQFNTS